MSEKGLPPSNRLLSPKEISQFKRYQPENYPLTTLHDRENVKKLVVPALVVGPPLIGFVLYQLSQIIGH